MAQPTAITWELHYPAELEHWRAVRGTLPANLVLDSSRAAFAKALAEELHRRYPQATLDVYWVEDEPDDEWPNIFDVQGLDKTERVAFRMEIERVHDAVLARGEFYRTT
jgi:hypothetical protein